MSIFVEVVTAPTPNIEIVGNGVFNVVVETPTPIITEIMGVHYISQFVGDSELVIQNITEPEAQEDFILS